MAELYDAHHEAQQDHAKVPYFAIFATLVVFTGITIAASYFTLGTRAGNAALALAIAGFKASLVMLFFMHLKYEKRGIVLIALAPFFLVGVLILALVPDIVYGQYH
jgi:cytochrome c oxidase subunit 4